MQVRLITIDELSNYIGLKPQTIRNQLSNGTFPIPAKKIGGALRWEIREVDKYLDKLKPHQSYKRKEGDAETNAALWVPSEGRN